MHPKRFIESSCLKCHHQVTDLITTQNKNEAPKLVRGYNLIKEFGCFGCHEIHGQKDGRAIGPDLRLEPNPPLESLPAGLRARLLADKENPPGTMRKVGPSLYRLDEKTNEQWTARWLLAPRDFRPDTKMPHFYGLSNNDPSVLPDKQKKFPSAEIYAVTHVLFKSSRDFLGDVKTAHDEFRAKKKELEALRQKGKNLTEKEAAELTKLQREVDELPSLVAQLQDKTKLTSEEKAEFDMSVPILKLRETPAPITADPELPKNYNADPYEGRKLFTERGCLACHTHQGTTKEYRVKVKEKNEEIEKYLPAVVGESQFGPNLSQVSEKLIEKKGDVTRARRWLIHWLKNPQAHSPRSRMPITHLTNEEAAQIADWLLSQEPQDLGKDWKDRQVTKPDLGTLRELAKVYLVDKVLSQHETEELLNGKLPKYRRDELPQEEKDLAARLADKAGAADQHLTWYVGRKGINRLGCYACHDIPGYEQAKPIGTPLNEWGKKDAERLAFENIAQFIKDKYHRVDSLVDEQGKPVAGEKDKPPYERYFAEDFSQKEKLLVFL